MGRILHAFVGGEEHSLKNVGEVSQIEDVVEFDCCGREDLGDFGMELEGRIQNVGTHFLDRETELVAWVVKVVGQDSVVDGEQ